MVLIVLMKMNVLMKTEVVPISAWICNLATDVNAIPTEFSDPITSTVVSKQKNQKLYDGLSIIAKLLPNTNGLSTIEKS